MQNNPDINSTSSFDSTHELSSIVIPLLKGVIYRDENPGLWGTLLNQQAGTRDYVTVLGLELMLDEAEGYAYLRSREDTNDDHDNRSKACHKASAFIPCSYPSFLKQALRSVQAIR